MPLDVETLKWCEEECRKESARMRDIGLKHPENSPPRDRCMARARSLHNMAELFLWKYKPDNTKILRSGQRGAQINGD